MILPQSLPMYQHLLVCPLSRQPRHSRLCLWKRIAAGEADVGVAEEATRAVHPRRRRRMRRKIPERRLERKSATTTWTLSPRATWSCSIDLSGRRRLIQRVIFLLSIILDKRTTVLFGVQAAKWSGVLPVLMSALADSCI